MDLIPRFNVTWRKGHSVANGADGYMILTLSNATYSSIAVTRKVVLSYYTLDFQGPNDPALIAENAGLDRPLNLSW